MNTNNTAITHINPGKKDDLHENLPEKKDDLNIEKQKKMFQSDILVLACEPIRLLVHQSLHPHYHKSNSKKTPPMSMKSEFNPHCQPLKPPLLNHNTH